MKGTHLAEEVHRQCSTYQQYEEGKQCQSRENKEDMIYMKMVQVDLSSK